MQERGGTKKQGRESSSNKGLEKETWDSNITCYATDKSRQSQEKKIKEEK